jgi:septal ring factor EnvC (AmiA/AmiB activator)
MEQSQKVAEKSFETKLDDFNAQKAKEIQNLERTIEGKVGLIEMERTKNKKEMEKEENLQSQIKSQSDKIKNLQAEQESLKKQIDELKKTDQDLSAKNSETAKSLKEEKVKNTELADKLKGSEAQVLDERKKEEAKVAEMHKYIQEEQTSKVLLSKEMKSQINSLKDNFQSEKETLYKNIATYSQQTKDLKK